MIIGILKYCYIEKKKRTRGSDWDDEILREKLLQEQALRELKAANNSEKVSCALIFCIYVINCFMLKAKINFDPIKPGESLKKFQRRVREETKKVSILSNEHNLCMTLKWVILLGP